MLQSKRNRITISILDKLRDKGPPGNLSPVPNPGDGEDFEEAPEYEDLDPMGHSVTASPVQKKQKKKSVADL